MMNMGNGGLRLKGLPKVIGCTVILIGVMLAMSVLISAEADKPLVDDQDFIDVVQPETDAEHRQRVDRTLRALTEGQAALNRSRSFVLKVVDQDGRSVPQVSISFSAHRYLKVIHPSGKMFEVNKQLLVTDQQGLARSKVDTGAIFEAKISASELPLSYDVGIKDYEIVFELGKPQDVFIQNEGDKLRTEPGVDWVFRIHRFIGPRPLLFQETDTNQLPVDGSPFPWSVFHPIYSFDRFALGREAEAEPFADFKVRIWMDPGIDQLLTITEKNEDGIESTRYRPNPAMPWWCEITCLRGGLAEAGAYPIGTASNIGSFAPEVGYRQRVTWSGSQESDRIDQPYRHIFWWKRTGTPTRYACVVFQPIILFRSRPNAHLGITMSGRITINPAAEDRLIEFPIGRSATWITNLQKDLATQWIAEPAGDPDPTIEQVEQRAIPSP